MSTSRTYTVTSQGIAISKNEEDANMAYGLADAISAIMGYENSDWLDYIIIKSLTKNGEYNE